MTKRSSLLSMAFLALMALPLHAQPAPPVVPPVIVVITNVSSGQALAALEADFETLAPFTTNGNAAVFLGAGENTSTKKPIYGAQATIPMNASGSVSVTLVGGYYQGAWLEGGGTLTLSKTNNWWILRNVRESIGDGTVYNFKKQEFANYAYTEFDKSWVINSRMDFHAGVLAANISDIPGLNVFAGVGLDCWWGGIGRH